MKILGIETSCDETAIGVVEDGVRMLSSVVSSQVELHATYGGVVPELASRQHVEAIIPVLDEALARASCSLQKIDAGVVNAALSLNASPLTALRRIVLPQIMPGVLSGSLIVFGLSASSFAIPGLLGGRRLKMMATLIYDEYLHELNWPLGAAIALLLLLANLVIMLGWNRMIERRYKKALG